jgi:thiol-disulfide isomerase/thioredoxin
MNPVLMGKELNHLLFEPLLKPVNSHGLSKMDIEHKYILLDFFTQSCLPCITSFPRLKELQKFSLLKQNLIVLGLDPNPEDSATMLKFINRYRLEHGIITGSAAIKLNNQLNPVNIFPFYILIDLSGKIIAVEEGYNDDFFKRIEVLIKGNGQK